MSFPPQSVRPVVERIAELLRERRETLAVSESACAGLISSYIVSVPGASQYFHGGTLAYMLKSRLKLSGWSQKDIDSYTGPSKDVAARLARNLRLELGSTYTLAENGWAGPTGDKVGTVYLALSAPAYEDSVERSTDSTDRGQTMHEFAVMALEYLLEYLESR